ncbi:transglycosylase domain-containing protein [Luteolibacter pohnpeiensis]|uniref:peptidoglycan glycosyltransferase n=1 Tax=Luteolibacter pohnpeiensis TaxID=454153 RepID=A0A934SCI6_9BACT|nr:transglycosylase domain-containing protein [Luteolibacter pohnpeiensis]MBK1882753.1 transglycosylase domain-containing protein [Luteolibacter pohnpeiensis]
MAQRKPADPNRRRNQKAAATKRSPDAFNLFLFWPFYLVNFLTRNLSFALRILARLIGHPLAASLYVLLFLSVVYGFRASRYDLNKLHAMPERTIILDRNGEEIGRIHGEKRSIVPLRQVAENFRKAIIAREDERFYKHGAFDIMGIGRAVMKNLEGKKEGASTITQQLASDIFQLKRRDQGQTIRQIDRKFLEIAIAVRIEAAMSKDEILEAYINQINWGRQIKGVGEASRIYFEKHPSELTLSESAMLAGIVRGPDVFNPFSSNEAATRERNTTLERMVDAGVLTRKEADEAKSKAIEVRPEWRRKYHESYAMDAIRRELEVILEKSNIELGGLTIHTTIDLRLQQSGEEALNKKLREVERQPGYAHQTRSQWAELPEDKRGDPDYMQGAALIMENHTGAVLAIIGGRDADESRYNRAMQARRPIGSVFKPFVYLAAFDKGLTPQTQISDGPIQPGEIKGGGNWRPHNSDGKFGGMFPASYGLIRSRNTMSVRVGNYAGMDHIKEVARNVGFTSEITNNPASLLGTWDASPWEVTSAYSIFPNEGERQMPFLITEIRDRDGNVLHKPRVTSYTATNAGSAWSVSQVLNQVTVSGTASAIKRLGFDKPCGGKTGTTNDFKDAWFAGYTSNLTCAVWVGFDQPKKTIQGGYGATLALPVWVDIMKTADRLGYKAGELNRKVNLVTCRLCNLSGKRATAGCEEAGTAYDAQVPSDIAPDTNDFCPIHPVRALPVSPEDLRDAQPANSPQQPTRRDNPPRALPVQDPQPPRALPIDEPDYEDPPPPRALPVR